jgi:hypothetical protein
MPLNWVFVNDSNVCLFFEVRLARNVYAYCIFEDLINCNVRKLEVSCY